MRVFSTLRVLFLGMFCWCLCTAERCSDDPDDFPCDDQFEVEKLPNRQYGATEQRMHQFDFYKPVGDFREPAPLLILVHPGAFMLGDKSDYFVSQVAVDFARCGFATASVNYRLIPEMLNAEDLAGAAIEWEHPIKRQLYDAIRDVRTAIRFFKANAAAYHIDPNRIYLAGYSAGAFIALHIAFMQDGESAAFFTKPVVSGPGECFDCLPFPGEGETRQFDATVAGVVAINGALFDANCVSDADAARTPVFFVYSDNDLVIPDGIGKPYQELLDQKDIVIDLPYIAFELGITRTTQAGEVEKTTIHGLKPSIVIPKWLPKLAASSVTPKVYGSNAIMEMLHRKHRHHLVLKGGHNFVADPKSGELNANYRRLCSEIKPFFLKIDNKIRRKNKPRRSERRRD